MILIVRYYLQLHRVFNKNARSHNSILLERPGDNPLALSLTIEFFGLSLPCLIMVWIILILIILIICNHGLNLSFRQLCGNPRQLCGNPRHFFIFRTFTVCPLCDHLYISFHFPHLSTRCPLTLPCHLPVDWVDWGFPSHSGLATVTEFKDLPRASVALVCLFAPTLTWLNVSPRSSLIPPLSASVCVGVGEIFQPKQMR